LTGLTSGTVRVVRLVAALAIAFALIFAANLEPEALLRFERFTALPPSILVAVGLSAVAVVWIRKGGFGPAVQSRGWRVLVESGAGACLLLAATSAFGVLTTPMNLCFGGSGGYVCYPNEAAFGIGVAELLAVVAAEELFFRAYLINEVNGLIGYASVGTGASALVYTLYHLPALAVEGQRAFSVGGFLLVLVGALTLSFCYWYSGRNLAATVMLHGYWDGVGALLLIPGPGVWAPVAVMLGQLTLPALGVVAVHQVLKRRPRDGAGPTASAVPTRGPAPQGGLLVYLRPGRARRP
jgi:Type II CAAX prenyl endopeptidase Rce1-like